MRLFRVCLQTKAERQLDAILRCASNCHMVGKRYADDIGAVYGSASVPWNTLRSGSYLAKLYLLGAFRVGFTK